MRTDRTICLNSKVDGKQPYIEDRIYWAGGASPGITATFASYGYWVLYETSGDIHNDAGAERGGEAAPASPRGQGCEILAWKSPKG